MPMISRWEFVPGVKTLDAWYDFLTNTLTLKGEGDTNLVTYGYQFVPDKKFVGGLAFDFMGYVGPALRDDYHYRHVQSFTTAPFPGSDLESVIIRTRDHPEGQVVKVQIILADGSSQSTAPIARATKNVVAPVILPPPTVIKAYYETTFEIQADTTASDVNIRFDTKFVTLKDSGVRGGRIWWEFFAIRMGSTDIVLDYGTPEMPGNTRFFDVSIMLPGVPSPVEASGAATDLVEPFFSGLNTAVGIVQKKWPDAELYLVECETPRRHPYPAETAEDISQLKVTFRAGDGRVTITDNGWWSDWNPPVYSGGIIVGNSNIQWPYNKGPDDQRWSVDLETAVKLLAEDPRTPKPTEFWKCTLVCPLTPDFNQPTYEFTLVGNAVWYVGGRDRRVWTDKPQDD